MTITLSDRLDCCASHLCNGQRVADIGCDHGYLGIYLLQHGYASSVIAADVNEGPLQSAMRNAEKYGVKDKMTFHLSDGANNIPRDFDALVCAGMGADTIIHILENAPWLKAEQYNLILQCQSKTPTLRRYLSDNGWHIAEETIVRDGKFLYTVMCVYWRPLEPRLTPGECYITPAMLGSINHLLPEYYEWVTEGLRIATAHKDDPEKKQALFELESNPNLNYIREMPAMHTVSDILNYLDTLAPRSMKMDWDNVGLLCGDMDAQVTKILVALDPFEAVVDEAQYKGAELIITHHPLIFQPLKAITEDNQVGRCIRKLCFFDINAINAHTNLDCAPGGVNDRLAQMLGLENIQVIDPMGVDAQGQEWGLLRMGDVAQQPLCEFLETVKSSLSCEGLRYVYGGKPVRKVAVGGGACAGEMRDAIRAGCDTFVTSDVKYNQFWDAQTMGLNLIDAGHFATENPIVGLLAQKLKSQFPSLEIVISEKHTDCVKFY
jgi:dinuclear metal center YbgI/SA1388 family protein